jgi:hypothetical protein
MVVGLLFVRRKAMKWITRAHVHVDRVACPWLIQRFIDPDAEFTFVMWPGPELKSEDGTPFDFPDLDIEFTHHDNKCTFEVIIEHFKLKDPILHQMATIIHGADVQKDRNLVPESQGVELTLSGLSYLSSGDHEAIALGFRICDSIYAGLLLKQLRDDYRQQIAEMSREDAFQFMFAQLRSRLPSSIQVGPTR